MMRFRRRSAADRRAVDRVYTRRHVRIRALARSLARVRVCAGARVFGTRPTLASLPVYPLPFRRVVVVTAQLYPQKPVFRLSHSRGNRERDWRRPSPS